MQPQISRPFGNYDVRAWRRSSYDSLGGQIESCVDGWIHSTRSRSEHHMGDTATARARWELENNVQAVDDVDALFKYNAEADRAVQQQKPWSKDPHYFKQ